MQINNNWNRFVFATLFAISFLFNGAWAAAESKTVTSELVRAQVLKLKSNDENEQQQAFDTLRGYGERAAKIVANSLTDSDVEFRTRIANLLLEYKSPDSLPKISRVLRNEEEFSIRRILIKTLGRIGNEEAIGLIKDRLSGDKHPAVKRDCLYALGATRDPRLIDVLLEFGEKEDDSYLQNITCQALRQLTGQHVEDKICNWRQWWEGRRAEVMKRFDKKQAAEQKKASTANQ